MAAIWWAPSAAQESSQIPEELLDTDHAQCMAGCLQNNSEKVCTIVCNCTINLFRERLDILRYRALKAEMERGTLGVSNRIFLDETGQYCAAELERLMPEGDAPVQQD